MGFIDTAARTRRKVIAEIGLVPAENYQFTLAAGVAKYAVGDAFCTDETGTMRRYERIAAAPGYSDLGDEAAPPSRSEVARNRNDADAALSARLVRYTSIAAAKATSLPAGASVLVELAGNSIWIETTAVMAAGGKDIWWFDDAGGKTWVIAAREYLRPDMFWFVPGALLDHTIALQAANDAAWALGCEVAVNRAYTLRTQFVQSAPLRGVSADAAIVIAPDYKFPVGVNPIGQAVIRNRNLSLTYNALTADQPIITDIAFDWQCTTGGMIIVVANTRGARFERLTFKAPFGTARCDAYIDIYACSRNFIIRKCDGDNTSGTSGGGNVWIRNITSAGGDLANATQDGLVDECEFATGTLDEAFAIYGCNGLVQRITVRKTKFRASTAAGTRKHGTLVSVFPRAYDAQPLTAGVRDILFDDCTFITSNFNDHVLRFGRTNDGALLCENIWATNCRIYATQADVRVSHVLRNIPGLGGNCGIRDSTLRTSIGGVETTQLITFGVIGFDIVEGCDIDGTFERAGQSCAEVRYNKRIRNKGSNALKNCGRVIGNIAIIANDTGVLCEATGFYEIRGNGINVAKTDGLAGYGILFNVATLADGTKTAPAGDVTINRFTTSYGLVTPVAVTAGVGRVRVTQNGSTGLGQATVLNSALLTEMWGNDWYGLIDANVTLTVAGDADIAARGGPDMLVTINAPLKADRSIALPLTGVKDGYRCRVVRLDYATGNFAALIKRDTVTIKAMPAANTHADFIYIAGQWKSAGALA